MFNIEKTGSEQTFGLQPFQVLLSLKPWKFSTKFLLGSFCWDKVFKNGLSKICGRQLLKNLK